MKPLYALISTLTYLILRLLYNIQVHSKENIPDGPAIIAPNHVSYLDPPIIGATSPKEIHFLANAKLFKYKSIGWFIGYLNTHPVNTASQDTHALKTVLKLLQEGNRVLIFPEGTRSPTGDLKTLKLGCAMLAMNANVPIIPTLIEGSFEIWPRTQKRPRLKGQLKVTYGPPLYPSKDPSLSKKEAQIKLTQQIEKAILDLKSNDLQH